MKNEKLVDAIGMIDDKYVEEAHKVEKKKFFLSFDLIGKLAVAAVCLLLVVVGIPSLLPKMGSAKTEAAPAEAAPAMSEEYAYDLVDAQSENGYIQGNTENTNADDNKKLIVTGNLNIETLEFDKVLDELNKNIKEAGGYVQSSSINYWDSRHYSATIRIPADKYNDFVSKTKENVNVTYYNENVDDITSAYTDLKARVNSLKAEESKVLEFYDKATNLDELLTIESRLTDIRYEIDSLETKLKNYDLLTSYSTLNINISETKIYTKTNENFFTRLKMQFVNGCTDFINLIEDIILTISYNFFTIILLVVIIVVVVKVIKKIINKKNGNK